MPAWGVFCECALFMHPPRKHPTLSHSQDEFLKAMSGQDPKAKQHADHMWKFLDELAQNDPEEYKK